MPLAVIANRKDLLGARMRNWLSAWRFARQIGVPTIIVWRNWDEREIPPYDVYTLFDRHRLERIESLRVEQIDPPTTSQWEIPAEWSKAQLLDVVEIPPDHYRHLRKDVLIDYAITGPRYFPGDTADAEAAEISTLFKSLPLQAAVDAAVRDFTAAVAAPFVAIHLRRGNLVEYLFERRECPTGNELGSDVKNFVSRYAHVNAYLRALQAHSPICARIAVFSDDAALRAKVSELLDGRIIDVHRILDRHHLTELQRAFA